MNLTASQTWVMDTVTTPLVLLSVAAIPAMKAMGFSDAKVTGGGVNPINLTSEWFCNCFRYSAKNGIWGGLANFWGGLAIL